ncbi:hypothetical protein GBAR_LOCUS12550 [Geodia barretti]|uniref:Uncharacterized protein n=1 Tax=Geodia barretti TaxID=519541 RepID=A0AA35WNN6_GEOBA|nr:hypothetical protein GBAR_LOCUS12550 [Geodia barretti]
MVKIFEDGMKTEIFSSSSTEVFLIYTTLCKESRGKPRGRILQLSYGT